MRECRKTKGIYGRVEKKQQIAIRLSADRHKLSSLSCSLSSLQFLLLADRHNCKTYRLIATIVNFKQI